MAASAAFLLLIDSRLPTGAHAHSGGMEEAVAAGRVRGVGDLPAWLTGRLHTVGAVDAAFAAAAHSVACTATAGGWQELDAEWAARIASPALRHAGRTLGRGVLRAARSCWPHPALDALAQALPGGAAWPMAVGAAGHAAGCAAADVALAAASAAVSGPAWACTRLLGSDPFAVAAVLAGMSGAIDAVAAAAAEAAAAQVGAAAQARRVASWPSLPAPSAPLLDLGAELHAGWEVRLFAS